MPEVAVIDGLIFRERGTATITMASNGKGSSADSVTEQVASVYAKAFLGAAQATGKAGVLVNELQSLITDVMDQYPEFERLLASAIIGHDEKLEIVERVFGGRASRDLVAFLKVVAAHGRLDCLRAILRMVVLRYHQMQGIVDVTVEAARRLTDSARGEIEEHLRRMLGAEPQLSVVTRPELIGGLVITIGDTVLDGSVATQLQQLRGQIVQKCVEQIETNRQRFLVEPA